MKNSLRVKQAQVIAALIMAIVVWVTTVGLGLNTGITGAAPVASKFNTGIAGAASLNHKCDQDQKHQKHQMTPLWDPSSRCLQKVPLTRTNRDCFGNPVGTSTDLLDHGFSIISETESRPELLIAVVVLRNATPNATYNIRLIQTPSGSGCAVVPGAPTLKTDAWGNGTAFVQEFVLPGSSDAFVVLNNAANFSGDFFTTREVFFR